jgi:hypothetical protein
MKEIRISNLILIGVIISILLYLGGVFFYVILCFF